MKSISKIFFASEIIIFLLAVLSIFIIQTSLIAAANAANMSCPPPKTLESRTSLKRLNAISPSSISGKKILFIEDADSFNNTDWDGFTDLGNLLINMGFEVWYISPSGITTSLLSVYDIVVFSINWSNALAGQREISQTEANALINFVNSGKGLFLVGEHGLGNPWQPAWNNSVNKTGQNFGMQVQMNMLCDPTNHYVIDTSLDPDGGVDSPIISNFASHTITTNINQFNLNWGASLSVSAPAFTVAYSDSDSWRDINGTWNSGLGVFECYKDSSEPSGTYPVLAVAETSANGRVVTIGDSSWMVNAWISYYDNYYLAENIFTWLGSGSSNTFTTTTTVVSNTTTSTTISTMTTTSTTTTTKDESTIETSCEAKGNKTIIDFSESGWANPSDSLNYQKVSMCFLDPTYSKYYPGKGHIGADLQVPWKKTVYNMCSGTVLGGGQSRQALDVVNARAVVKCDDADVAIVYGHITGFAGKIGKHINKGTALGTVMYWPINNSHLHLGVNVFGQAYMKWPWGFGRCPKSATPEEVASHGWVDPIEYLLSNSLK